MWLWERTSINMSKYLKTYGVSKKSNNYIVKTLELFIMSCKVL